jgi:RNA polymerase sigma-70 factor, ECF subfamily
MNGSEELRRGGLSPQLAAALQQQRTQLRRLAGLRLGRRLSAKVDPSDIVQETLLRASRGIGQFRGGPQRLRSWLGRILDRTVLDALRRFGRARCRDPRREEPLAEALDHDTSSIDPALLASGSTPSRQVNNQEQRIRMEQAMQCLPVDCRQVLLMHHREGLSIAAIALRTGQSPAVVRRLWIQALNRMRQQQSARSL